MENTYSSFFTKGEVPQIVKTGWDSDKKIKTGYAGNEEFPYILVFIYT